MKRSLIGVAKSGVAGLGDDAVYNTLGNLVMLSVI